MGLAKVSLATGRRADMAAALNSAVKFPQSLDGRYFAGEYGRQWIKAIAVNADGSPGEISAFPWTGTLHEVVMAGTVDDRPATAHVEFAWAPEYLARARDDEGVQAHRVVA